MKTRSLHESPGNLHEDEKLSWGPQDSIHEEEMPSWGHQGAGVQADFGAQCFCVCVFYERPRTCSGRVCLCSACVCVCVLLCLRGFRRNYGAQCFWHFLFKKCLPTADTHTHTHALPLGLPKIKKHNEKHKNKKTLKKTKKKQKNKTNIEKTKKETKQKTKKNNIWGLFSAPPPKKSPQILFLFLLFFCFFVFFNVFFVFFWGGGFLCFFVFWGFSLCFLIIGGPKANFCCYLQRFFVFGGPKGNLFAVIYSVEVLKANFCCHLERFFVIGPKTNVWCYFHRPVFWKSQGKCLLLFKAFVCGRPKTTCYCY